MNRYILTASAVAMLALAIPPNSLRAELRAGAAKVDVTADQLPVLINGGMYSRSADQVKTRVHARAIVLDDGAERIAIVVVDSCMLPRELLDEAKQLASTRTRLRPDRILISATHSHSAPSAMGALGTDVDPTYVPLLRQRLVEALVAAEANLAPARVGWGSGQAPELTALRRWVRRPDRIADDPFGNFTVRANMHAGRNPDDAIGTTGPEDPELSLIALESLDGKPIAALANFSMHYFSDTAISADYYGLFCDGFEEYLTARAPAADGAPPPVALMSHGCSGDVWRRDYFLPAPEKEMTIVEYAQALLQVATAAHGEIDYQADADLAMREARLPMRYRVPDKQRLQWAEGIMAEMGDRLPKTLPEVYAREQVLLDQLQSTEVVVQALRIGDIAIASTPTETYALTGLKLKLQSPLPKTMVIELANGGDGYIPPPEQHYLGGYNTWPARSAGLEVTAEPRIVAADLALLEQVAEQPRRAVTPSIGPAAQALLDKRPIAYWRLNEMSPVPAHDASGGGRSALFEPGVLFFLDGPLAGKFTREDEVNRCAHFAGGRMHAELPELDRDFTVVLSFWNGMPVEGREVAGWMFSRDHDRAVGPRGIHLGLSGSAHAPGRLLLKCGDGDPVVGRTEIERWQWATAALVRSGDRLQVFLAGQSEAEIDVTWKDPSPAGDSMGGLFFGGRSDNDSNWEGRLDEIAIYDRAIGNDELEAMARTLE